MHYLIDGHNLIGKMPDIELDDPDDEIKLILRLRSWTGRVRSRRVTVVFDHGLPGGKDRGLSTSKVQVLFASGGQTADSILITRIKNATDPRQYTVVTSDNRIRRQAEMRRMPALKAEEFAQQLAQKAGAKADGEVEDSDPGQDQELSDAELQMWIDLFDAQDEPKQ